MTVDDVRKLVTMYRSKFDNYTPKQCEEDYLCNHKAIDDRLTMVRHIAWCMEQMLAMCDEIDSTEEPPHLVRKKTDKLMRWLGFVQGFLWSCGIASILELKHHNKYGWKEGTSNGVE